MAPGRVLGSAADGTGVVIRLDRPAVIGVDPGPTTGIAVLDIGDYSHALIQTTPDDAAHIIRSYSGGSLLRIALERFVVRRRSGRSSAAEAGRITRDLVGALSVLEAELGVPVTQRSAAEVKPWASDARLRAAGLWPSGMPHARDAGRHALFTAVADCGAPDPLSRTSPSTNRSPR